MGHMGEDFLCSWHSSHWPQATAMQSNIYQSQELPVHGLVQRLPMMRFWDSQHDASMALPAAVEVALLIVSSLPGPYCWRPLAMQSPGHCHSPKGRWEGQIAAATDYCQAHSTHTPGPRMEHSWPKGIAPLEKIVRDGLQCRISEGGHHGMDVRDHVRLQDCLLHFLDRTLREILLMHLKTEADGSQL